MKVIKFRNSIFSRLIITFLIILVPIYVLGIYIYNWELHTVKDEISKSTISQVSFYLEGLEKEVERIKILQYDCLNDNALNKLTMQWTVMNNYERTENMWLLQQKLVSIKNSSAYIKNVSAHILPIKKTISSNNGVDTIDMVKFKAIRVPSNIHGAQIIKFKDGFYLSTLQQSNLSNNESLYMIEIELNQDTLKQALAQFNTYNESGSVLINSKDKSIISNQSELIKPLSDDIIANLNKKDSKEMKFTKINQKRYCIIYAESNYLNMALFRYIPEELILKPIQNFYIWVLVFSIVTIAIIFIYSFFTYKFMHKPLQVLVTSFQKVENGDFQVSINHNQNNEFGYLYKRFNDMVKSLNTLINQVYNQKILMQRAELKQLQSQINPHFLYNSFFIINTMARTGDDNLITFTKLLGEYFRFVTRNSSDYIPLEDEIKHARVYTSIQLMRFSKRLQVQFAECPEKYNNIKVPRLILQPIIENAFEHGIEKKKDNGIIKINFEANEEELNIIIEDNGNDMSESSLVELQKALEYTADQPEVTITGIINIHRRMKLVFGEESGLQISRSEMGGLKVIMKIKLSEGENNYV